LEHGWNAVVTARNSAKVQDIVAHHPDTALALASDVTDRAAGRRGAKTAGRCRIENDTTDGHQRGDAARGAQVIIKAVGASDSPHLLLLGSDAVRVVGAALDADRGALKAWETTS